MSIDYSSLALALASLKRAIDRAVSDRSDEELRDAVIQRFEYSYELCWKMLKRHLEQVVASPAEVDTLSFKELFRLAAERGLVADVEEWWVFRRQRNMTSHTYNAQNARTVFESALVFYPAALRLLGCLEANDDDSRSE